MSNFNTLTPLVHAVYLGVSLIHGTLIWTTGFLTCVCDLLCTRIHTSVYSLIRRTFVESAQNLTPEKSQGGRKAQHVTVIHRVYFTHSFYNKVQYNPLLIIKMKFDCLPSIKNKIKLYRLFRLPLFLPVMFLRCSRILVCHHVTLSVRQPVKIQSLTNCSCFVKSSFCFAELGVNVLVVVVLSCCCC